EAAGLRNGDERAQLIDVEHGGHGRGSLEFRPFKPGRPISLSLIGQIKNIRFTNQSPQCNISSLPEESGGDFGWFWAAPGLILARKGNENGDCYERKLPSFANRRGCPVAGLCLATGRDHPLAEGICPCAPPPPPGECAGRPRSPHARRYRHHA